MSGYDIKFTDNVNKGSITVDDGTTNSTDTSLVFPGRNYSNYGIPVNENFLHLLENFANNDSPRNPVEGQLWYDTTTGIEQLKIYDGTNWISSSGVKKSIAVPDPNTSNQGDLWVNTGTQQVFIYTGAEWILVGPDYSDGLATGSKFVNVISSDNQQVPVIINYINNNAVMIVSATEFIPKTTIQGFSKIYVGTNLSTNVGGYPAKYRGIAEKAESLVYNSIVIPADTVVRRDIENVLTRPLRIRHRNGLDIGESQTLLLQVEGSVGVISHKATGSSLDIRVNDGGTDKTAIRVRSNGNVGIGNVSTPNSTLEVVGSVSLTGNISVTPTDSNFTVNGGTNITGTASIAGTTTLNSLLKTKSIEPTENNVHSLGSSLLRYSNIHTTNMRIYGNLTIDGSIIGNATSSTISTVASRLSLDTTLTLVGDVRTVTPASINYGQGGNITINTVISDNIISDRTRLTDVTLDDDILVHRTGNTTVNKMSRRLFISSIIPVGTIVPFGGRVAPAGWSMCDGKEIDRNAHIELAQALGYSVSNPSQYLWGTASDPAKIKLPDLRGRFLLGWVDPANLSAPVGTFVSNPSANTIGSYGGKENTYITKDQLPEHEHSLAGDSGTQFYATSSAPGSTDSNSVSYLGVGNAVGSAMPMTAGIEEVTHTTQTINGVSQQVGNQLSLLNPCVTVNYIIYHGGPGV
jgi:microcystin-dependent protein